MKVAVVVFVIGERYINTFTKYFKNNLQNYCDKHKYDLIILDKLIKKRRKWIKKNFVGINT